MSHSCFLCSSTMSDGHCSRCGYNEAPVKEGLEHYPDLAVESVEEEWVEWIELGGEG